jgi:soluble lytic murein transglycosylase-like protein
MRCLRTRYGTLTFACVLSVITGPAWNMWEHKMDIEAVSTTQPSQSGRFGVVRTHAWDFCLQKSARRTGVHPALLHAIVKVESGRHPYAFGWYDSTGIWKSYRAPSYTEAVAHFRALEQQQIRFDVGLAQVNSRNLKILQNRIGIAPIQALDPCSNLHLAGLILREQIKIHGSNWEAVAGYNGSLTYAPRVYRAYCAQVPTALHCRTQVPLSHLLSYPLPVFPGEPPQHNVHHNPVIHNQWDPAFQSKA